MTALPVPSGADDHERMMTMLTGFWVTQIICAAATFNVADHLASGTDTAEAIAAEECIDPDATRRLIRACASLGLVTSTDGVRLSGTSLLSTLLRDDPNSLRGMVLAQAAPGHWLTWGHFPDAVRSGTGQMEAAHGTPGTIFDYLAAHPDEASHFTEAMSNLSGRCDRDRKGGRYPRRQIRARRRGSKRRGASGDDAGQPHLRGGVFDLPHIVPDAAAAARKEGLQERLTAVGGDFFESVPSSDLYVLKYILHDWDDQNCMRILRNCRAALQEGGRLVVIDYLVGEFGLPGLPAMMDMNMLVMNGGREREIAEFDALFASTGLRRTTVGQTGQFAVIEAVAI